LHSKLVKKKCLSDLLDDPPILELQKLFFLKENYLIITGDLSLLKLKNWSIFMDNLPLLNSKNNFSKPSYFLEIGLFSRVTYQFQIPKIISASLHAFLKLVYSHGQSINFKFQK